MIKNVFCNHKIFNSFQRFVRELMKSYDHQCLYLWLNCEKIFTMAPAGFLITPHAPEGNKEEHSNCEHDANSGTACCEASA